MMLERLKRQNTKGTQLTLGQMFEEVEADPTMQLLTSEDFYSFTDDLDSPIVSSRGPYDDLLFNKT